jgi:hypothetical protein
MTLVLATAFLLLGLVPGAVVGQNPPPRAYEVARAATPPVVDGRLVDAVWSRAPWTADFVDIEGPDRPAPPLRTRVKMLWDDTYLYVAAALEEPHVWATVTERDAVIFRDDDFEVFIDPDGDALEYYELEINALGTVWDLFLTKPYREGGRALDAWDIRGLVHGVRVDGTVNDPSDRDRGWSVELALPWSVLEEAAPHRGAPRPGETWRMNFSRVDWDMRVENGRYVKELDPETGRPRSEHNWAWTPQWEVNMHAPEHWGRVTFRGRSATSPEARPGAESGGWP